MIAVRAVPPSKANPLPCQVKHIKIFHLLCGNSRGMSKLVTPLLTTPVLISPPSSTHQPPTVPPAAHCGTAVAPPPDSTNAPALGQAHANLTPAVQLLEHTAPPTARPRKARWGATLANHGTSGWVSLASADGWVRLMPRDNQMNL